MIPYSAAWLYSNIGARTPSTSYTSHTLSIPMSSTRTRTKATIGDQPACARRSEEEQTELASCHPWESVEHMALLVVIASQLLASIVWCARRKKGQNWIWMYHAIFVHSGRRRDYIERWRHNIQERPYNHDSTASRLLSEVKHDLARLVLRWGTTLESLVLFFYFYLLLSLLSQEYSTCSTRTCTSTGTSTTTTPQQYSYSYSTAVVVVF